MIIRSNRFVSSRKVLLLRCYRTTIGFARVGDKHHYGANIEDIQHVLQVDKGVVIADDTEMLYPNCPYSENAPNLVMITLNINEELNIVPLYESEVCCNGFSIVRPL